MCIVIYVHSHGDPNHNIQVILGDHDYGMAACIIIYVHHVPIPMLGNVTKQWGQHVDTLVNCTSFKLIGSKKLIFYFVAASYRNETMIHTLYCLVYHD